MKDKYIRIILVIPAIILLIVLLWWIFSQILGLWRRSQNMSPLFLVLFLGIPIIMLIFFIPQSRKMKKLVKQLAVQRNGTHLSDFENEGFRFVHGSSEIIYQTHMWQKRNSTYSRVKVELPHDAGREMLFIFHESLVIKGLKRLHLKDIQTGNEEFDRAYGVQGDDERAVISLLTPNIQNNLLLLKKFKPRVHIEKRELRIEVWKLLLDEDTINLMIDTALLLLDRFIDMKK
jgi:hypothetical protein